MTKLQAQQFARMYHALSTIARDFQTPSQLQRNSEKQYGLQYEEALEMSYENIQSRAAAAIKCVRLPKEVTNEQKQS